ncbi:MULTISPECIES: hypothetical protein [unclassified Rhodococcus (in: high G+C Gram-positive bacteria)]|uniref:hypothetical protein n=1 Tax=unclassified Rhodococcus (in: high G+C Gram-positive bacteria) TaxID=192944 RepID=UPI000B9B4E15|nr:MULTISPECIES: hypothetical protein [unclassified Rhodococcus (in: high G+C Gram-positive bacteria)]OZE36125.1 hypothetical protein CH259_13575 [Rhodococcus sp. 05-2254-4]OZE41236.1 hypothetical protein CH261_25040 [Rhodococcus sp. 05-2254-3]OZE44583.1 hypothetical protein CH283_27295 [Rhodococcus sp. 05-2254-2]
MVSAFYDSAEPRRLDASVALRDDHLPLPTIEDDYRRVLMIGTTGAGKTTVIRQMLGTDPDRDRFPSTSTAKTTVADTEIIVADGPYKAVVTFFSSDEVTDHLLENGVRAALLIRSGAAPDAIRSALLDHENQRFRFSYVFGRKQNAKAAVPVAVETSEFDEFDEFDEFEESDSSPGVKPVFDAEPTPLDGIDLDFSSSQIDAAIEGLKFLVSSHAAISDDGEADEEVDSWLRQQEMFHGIVDSLLDDMDKRFRVQHIGTLSRDHTGWPESWHFESDDRATFLKTVNRFTSNYAPLFGHLLTPLVDGIRVSGPFLPDWADGELPKMVLIDGEGLGHTSKSSAALPTSVAHTINHVDAVVLVDNAQQPMQAAPTAAIRSILTSGNIEKLIFCFTHFEDVQGDNLTSASDRAHHVLASVDNVISAIRKDFGQRPEQSVRERLGDNRVFLAGIDQQLKPGNRNGKWSISQFKRLLEMIERSAPAPESGLATPVYERASLIEAIETGIRQFHYRWGGILGIAEVEEVQKQTWQKIKALSKRFAEGSADQYETLRPNAELREALKEEIYKALEKPARWNGRPPETAEDQAAVIDHFANKIAQRLVDPIQKRLSELPRSDWQISYNYSGTGSTVLRAAHISHDIFAKNVTAHREAPNSESTTFLQVVAATLEAAAEETDVSLT